MSADQPHADNAAQRVTGDFIFGDLSAGETLVASIKALGRGLRHDNWTDPVLPVANAAVTIRVSSGVDLEVVGLRAEVTTDGTNPTTESRSYPLVRADMSWHDLTWSYLQWWEGVLPAATNDTLVLYRIVATGPDGVETIIPRSDDATEPGLFGYWLRDPAYPPWLDDAVIYHLFIDRFATTDDAPWHDVTTLNEIRGGTLAGARAKLPYLRDLGVNCIWLSPLFPAPSHHGYDATDYFSVEQRLGSIDDVRGLIADAHELGIRVLLDFVANHTSDLHPAFIRARDEPDSTERTWFTFDQDGGYRSFYGVQSMPAFALDRAPARDHLFAAARHWLELGADGYRLDYALGPSHAFWSAFRQVVKTASPDAVLLGEVTGSAATQLSYQGRLDGTLDFLLLQELRAFFAFDVIDAGTFGRFLERHVAFVVDRLALPSFLDNHDMNRFLWVVRGDRRRLKLAALTQFVLPGPPIIYYGTEVGVSQDHDIEYPDGSRKPEESRTPMCWGDEQDLDLLSFYRRLIAFRRSHPASDRRAVRHIPTGNPGLLALAIGDRHLLVINRTDREQQSPRTEAEWRIRIATSDHVRVARDTVVLCAFEGCLLEDHLGTVTSG